MSKLAKINLLPAPAPLFDGRRVLFASGYLAVLLVVGYLAVGAFLRTQVLNLDLEVIQARTDLASRTVQREKQVQAAQAASDAQQKLADELAAIPLWSDLIPDLLGRLPAGISITTPIRGDRSTLKFEGKARAYEDLTAIKDALRGTRYANLQLTGPTWNVQTRDFSFGVTIVLTGVKQ